MKAKVDLWRVLFLTLTVLATVGAVAVQKFTSGRGSNIQLNVFLRSELIAEGFIPFEAMLIATDQNRFRENVGFDFQLQDSSVSDPSVFEAQVEAPSEFEARKALTKLKVELSSVLRTLATKTLVAQEKELQKIRTAAESGPKRSVPRAMTDRVEPIFHPGEREKSLRLSSEIVELERYLLGGQEPSWLNGRLNQKTLQNRRENLTRAQSQLIGLEEAYNDTSQAVIKQRQVVSKAREALDSDKRHQSRFLLDAYRQELNALEKLTESRIEMNAQNMSKAAEKKTAPSKDTKAKKQLFSKESEKLRAERKKLEELAEVQQIEEPVITTAAPQTYWVSVLLWATAGLSLLLALFRPTSPVIEEDEPKSAAPSPLSNFRPSLGQKSKAEPFLLNALTSIEEELGRPPRRLLILGDSQNKDRAGASARLARTISDNDQKVRLVDFDFQAKTLSKNLGNPETVGVSDLISSGAPVDEFLASVAGTKIEFAPAGNQKFVAEDLDSKVINSLLNPPDSGILIVDASFASPLHLVIKHIEAVICVTKMGRKWNEREQEVLLAIREAELPIWGLVQGDQQIYPFT